MVNLCQRFIRYVLLQKMCSGLKLPVSHSTENSKIKKNYNKKILKTFEVL